MKWKEFGKQRRKEKQNRYNSYDEYGGSLKRSRIFAAERRSTLYGFDDFSESC